MKTGVKKDGTITANEMYALSDTGAYGCHALTVTGNTGHKSMALYVGDGEYRKSTEHSILCRCGLYQHAASRRVPRLRRAPRLLARGASHGKNRARLESRSD